MVKNGVYLLYERLQIVTIKKQVVMKMIDVKMIEFQKVITSLPNAKLVRAKAKFNEAGNMELTGTIIQQDNEYTTIKNFREILDIKRGETTIRPIRCLELDSITIETDTFKALKFHIEKI